MIFTELTNESIEVHSTRLKEELIAAIPGLEANKQGRSIILNANEIPAGKSFQVHSSGDKSDGMCISKSTKVIEDDLFKKIVTVPVYLRLLIHAATGQKEVVNKLHAPTISCKRVDEIQASVAKELCEQFCEENLVVPKSLQSEKYFSAVIDNIDHNTISNTAANVFHGTSITIFQHCDAGAQLGRRGRRPLPFFENHNKCLIVYIFGLNSPFKM